MSEEEKVVQPVADVPVEFVEVKYQSPKELHEVCAALEKVVADVKAKKPVGEIVGGSFQELTAAVDKWDRIPGEARQAQRQFAERAGHFGGKITGTLLA